MTTKPKLKRDWIGLRVRSRHAIQNGLGTVPAGTMFTVTDSYAGLRMTSDKCPACGVQFYVSRVNQASVEIVERDEKVTRERSDMRRRRRRWTSSYTITETKARYRRDSPRIPAAAHETIRARHVCAGHRSAQRRSN